MGKVTGIANTDKALLRELIGERVRKLIEVVETKG
jgi:hypothetical protein